MIEAANPGDFITKLGESNPEQIGAFLKQNEDGIGWSWYICPIEIENLGEV